MTGERNDTRVCEHRPDTHSQLGDAISQSEENERPMRDHHHAIEETDSVEYKLNLCFVKVEAICHLSSLNLAWAMKRRNMMMLKVTTWKLKKVHDLAAQF